MENFDEFVKNIDKKVCWSDPFYIKVSSDGKLYYYDFYRYLNRLHEVLIMKSFKDEDTFALEVENLSKIFSCPVYSEDYDISTLYLKHQPASKK